METVNATTRISINIRTLAVVYTDRLGALRKFRLEDRYYASLRDLLAEAEDALMIRGIEVGADWGIGGGKLTTTGYYA